MIKPATWLSSIVRGDGAYIQAIIFSCDNGYIVEKKIELVNNNTKEKTTYNLLEGDSTCLFKYINKITPLVDTSFDILLIVDVYDYSEGGIVRYVDKSSFNTPSSWSQSNTQSFDISISSRLEVGKTSIEPTTRVIISGGSFPAGSRIRLCASNTLSNALSYNSYDEMIDFELELNVSIYEKTFSLGTSGTWYFVAYMTNQNGDIISISNTITTIVNQSDIDITEIVRSENILKLETGSAFVLNQIVGWERVGISHVDVNGVFQHGNFYRFSEQSGQDYDEYVRTTKLPTYSELEEYAAIKDTLVGWQNLHHLIVVSSEKDEATGKIKAWSFSSGAPTTVSKSGQPYSYLVLTPFENNISNPDPLTIPVFKSNLMIQPSGYKITDIAKSSDLGNYVKINSLFNPIELMSITAAPALEYVGPDYTGKKYYNSSDKKVYSAFEVFPGQFAWVEGEAPKSNIIYNFNGVSYMWDGADLVQLGINPGQTEMSNNFEEGNY